MATKGTQWLSLATLGGCVVLGVIAWKSPPVTPPLPPCVVEDGGPIPCVWDPVNQGTYHPGDSTDKVTITRAP
jgi:hypothetical protein